jgi:hypothetical protein
MRRFAKNFFCHLQKVSYVFLNVNNHNVNNKGHLNGFIYFFYFILQH